MSRARQILNCMESAGVRTEPDAVVTPGEVVVQRGSPSRKAAISAKSTVLSK